MTRDEALPLRRIELGSWGLWLVLVCAGAVAFGRDFTVGIVVGGLLVNVSFWLLKRDLGRLLTGDLTAVKARFFLKYYARLTLLAVLLYFLVARVSLNIPGLLLGLSVIFLSIAGSALAGAIKTFKMREAP